MYLQLVHDLDVVKSAYIDVIEHTPDIDRYARWRYGFHPSDDLLQSYMDKDEMYILTDGAETAGMVVISMSQGEDYQAVSWQEDLADDQVAVLHLLAVCPAFRGRSLGLRILEEAMDLALKKGKKVLRLDTLKSNIPAQSMYDKAGFSFRGEQKICIEELGCIDFYYYEKLLGTEAEYRIGVPDV